MIREEGGKREVNLFCVYGEVSFLHDCPSLSESVTKRMTAKSIFIVVSTCVFLGKHIFL